MSTLRKSSQSKDTLRQAEYIAWAFQRFQRFCGILDIVPKNGVRQKLTLNEIQKQYCEMRTPRDVVLKARQVGFTTLEQARDIWHFLTVPGARVVVVCQSMTDNPPWKLLATNYRVMFESLERAGLQLNFRPTSSREWVLEDRDATLRIVDAGASAAAAQKKGRAGTITRLHLTETAFWEYAEKTLNAMLECVPSATQGSEIVSESTPNGAAGKFYEQCMAAQAGTSGYRFHFFPWFRHSEYSAALVPGELLAPANDRERNLLRLGVIAEQLKWYRAKVQEKGSQDEVDQEYPSDPETCFLLSGRAFFDKAKTKALLEAAQSVEPLETRANGTIRIYKRVDPHKSYLLCGDPAEGDEGGNESGALVYERESGEHVATIQAHLIPAEFARACANLGREYNAALIAIERNNHGHAVLRVLLAELEYEQLYVHADNKLGWPTNPVTRPVMLDELQDSHKHGHWTSRDRAVLSQIRTFLINEQGKPEAAAGAQDDLVLAAAIGWAVRARRDGDTTVFGASSDRR